MMGVGGGGVYFLAALAADLVTCDTVSREDRKKICKSLHVPCQRQ